jgi:transposase-like protein
MTVNLTDPIFRDEDKARAYFEQIRWPNGPICPHCGNADASRIYSIAANPAKKIRAGLRECQDCHGQFTVRTGGVMESSHLPLTKWALAYRFMASSKKGMSAHQLHRSIGVTYKTAWFMWHRIRKAMRDASPSPLGGEGKVVEVDETFIGPAPDVFVTGRGWQKSRGHSNRRIVVSLVERGGPSRSIKVEKLDVATITQILTDNVARESRLHTDEAHHYRTPGRAFAKHERVLHSDKVYARDDVTTNTVEGFFSIFKRGMKGVYQHCGEQHLQRYLDEFDFRYSNRAALGVDDTERARRAIKGGEGKRLTYRPAGRA